jgi:hypothetical protein
MESCVLLAHGSTPQDNPDAGTFVVGYFLALLKWPEAQQDATAAPIMLEPGVCVAVPQRGPCVPWLT